MKIKYIFSLVLCILCSFVINAESTVLFDLYGVYTNVGDEGGVKGLGLTIAGKRFLNKYWDSNTGLYFSTYAAGAVENEDMPTEETRLFIPSVIGFRHMRSVMNMPLFWEISAGGGIAYLTKQGPEKYGVFIDPSKTRTDSDLGPHFELLAGLNYRISQGFAFFINGGYQLTSFHSDNISSNASGFQLSLGIRSTLAGNAVDLDEY